MASIPGIYYSGRGNCRFREWARFRSIEGTLFIHLKLGKRKQSKTKQMKLQETMVR
jgi:hypothetical protein